MRSQNIEDKGEILKLSREENTDFIHMIKSRKAVNISKAILKDSKTMSS